MTPTHTTRPRRAVALLTALALVSACATDAGQAPGQRVVADSFDAATRGDDEFNRRFRHEFADVDGVRMHYVTGGTGEPLVLLHGWPQSWYEWREIMPALADRYTVYALDLPGLGDSTGAPPSYDKATLARFVHGLVAGELGLSDINLVGHDLGAGVGFQYVVQYPEHVTRYAHLDYPLPGPVLSAAQYRSLSWHIAFHGQGEFPEAVVADDVREYLALFYSHVAYGGESFGGPGARPPFSEAQIDEFARTYRRPQVLTGGFELYRTLEQDERDNLAAPPIAVPTLLMTAEGVLAPIRSTVEPRMSRITRAVEVPGAGHWLPEENADFVTSELLAFFAG
ncbi:alpha/beta fold hydrolase [Actinophytocola xanthii]|uniref:Alpha/beta hydrolase n=1 Tax=Actinophytocola xanthii TaxID=1912961 RepID=A0A1Q8C900_9PSEU|nr:alpha/beta hydrolase [Actinophytocola xanthii]OLF10830.1 alpha/beta hydrolase [Actinophytocola xanthii]